MTTFEDHVEDACDALRLLLATMKEENAGSAHVITEFETAPHGVLVIRVQVTEKYIKQALKEAAEKPDQAFAAEHVPHGTEEPKEASDN